MKKTILSICCLGIGVSFSQVINEGFEMGIPDGWNQSTDDDLEWELLEGFGIEGSSCLLVETDHTGEGESIFLELPAISLAGISEPELVFSTASIGEFFVSPEIWIWVDTGDGWERIEGWGSGFWEAENEMIQTMDYEPPLSLENVEWNVNLSYDLEMFASETEIRFAFQANMVNSGYLLLDNVRVVGDDWDVSIDEGKTNRLKIYPNPTTGFLQFDRREYELETIRIFTTAGELVWSESDFSNENQIMLNLTGLSADVYLIEIVTKDKGKFTEQLVIQ